MVPYVVIHVGPGVREAAASMKPVDWEIVSDYLKSRLMKPDGKLRSDIDLKLPVNGQLAEFSFRFIPLSYLAIFRRATARELERARREQRLSRNVEHGIVVQDLLGPIDLRQ